MTVVEIGILCVIAALLAPVLGASVSLSIFIGVGIPLCVMLFMLVTSKMSGEYR